MRGKRASAIVASLFVVAASIAIGWFAGHRQERLEIAALTKAQEDNDAACGAVAKKLETAEKELATDGATLSKFALAKAANIDLRDELAMVRQTLATTRELVAHQRTVIGDLQKQHAEANARHEALLESDTRLSAFAKKLANEVRTLDVESLKWKGIAERCMAPAPKKVKRPCRKK